MLKITALYKRTLKESAYKNRAFLLPQFCSWLYPRFGVVVASVGLQFAERKGNAPKSCPEPHTLFNSHAKGGTSLIMTFEVVGHSKTAFEWEKGRKFPESNDFYFIYIIG